MEQKVDTKKRVFDKSQYAKTINTQFSELGVTNIVDAINDAPTVEQFFSLYDELFYDINALGNTNSHEYLVRTSGEYINFEQESEIIKALQEEITDLREQNLNLTMQLGEIESGNNINVTASLNNGG